MSKYRISDSDAEKLVTGVAPRAHPELGELANAIGEFRALALSSAPQPSDALHAFLDAGATTEASASIEGVDSTVQIRRPAPAGAARPRVKRKTVLGWFAGLGIIAKIALGSTVALAAVAGAGVAGVLPGGSQTIFNHVVANVTSHSDDPMPVPSENPSDDPSANPLSTNHPDNFGGQVSQLAHDPNKVGSDFGSLVSHEAHDKSNGSSDKNDGVSDSSDSGDGGSAGSEPSPSPTPTPTPSSSAGHGHDNSGGNGHHH